MQPVTLAGTLEACILVDPGSWGTWTKMGSFLDSREISYSLFTEGAGLSENPIKHLTSNRRFPVKEGTPSPLTVKCVSLICDTELQQLSLSHLKPVLHFWWEQILLTAYVLNYLFFKFLL